MVPRLPPRAAQGHGIIMRMRRATWGSYDREAGQLVRNTSPLQRQADIPVPCKRRAFPAKSTRRKDLPAGRGSARGKPRVLRTIANVPPPTSRWEARRPPIFSSADHPRTVVNAEPTIDPGGASRIIATRDTRGGFSSAPHSSSHPQESSLQARVPGLADGTAHPPPRW